MGTMNTTFKIILLFCAGLILAACGTVDHHEEGSLIERLEHGDEGHADAELNIKHLLVEINSVPVQSDLEIPFHTVARTGEIVKYPCSSCHEKPLEVVPASELRGVAHADIELNHADLSTLTCTSCHAADNLDSLHSLTGKPIEFDHSYQVCAQCHTQQVEDWEGGAHGKRVGGWAPPRVIETCTSCHNPHDPHLELRWPAVTGGGIQEQE